jgi:hypothetical protein
MSFLSFAMTFCRSLCKDRPLIPLVRRTCLTAKGGPCLRLVSFSRALRALGPTSCTIRLYSTFLQQNKESLKQRSPAWNHVFVNNTTTRKTSQIHSSSILDALGLDFLTSPFLSLWNIETSPSLQLQPPFVDKMFLLCLTIITLKKRCDSLPLT